MHCVRPTGVLQGITNSVTSLWIFSSVWIGTHKGISNNHCNTTVHITLFFCLHSLPSSSQAPPIIWLASSKLLCEPPARYSLLPHCISRVPCPLSKNFQELGLNQWGLVVRGCIKKAIEHAQWHTYFMSKQFLGEKIPAAWNHLHAIRKHKVKVEVSLETPSYIWGFSIAEKYAAEALWAAGDKALSREIISAPDISIWEITECWLICVHLHSRYPPCMCYICTHFDRGNSCGIWLHP